MSGSKIILFQYLALIARRTKKNSQKYVDKSRRRTSLVMLTKLQYARKLWYAENYETF